MKIQKKISFSYQSILLLFGILIFLNLFSALSFPSISRAQEIKDLPKVQEKYDQENLTDGPKEFMERRSLETSSLLWSTLKMLIVLVLVCLIAIFTLRFFLPKLSGFRTEEGDFIQILRRIPLEPRKSIFLIRVGERYHLLGVADQNVNHLMEVPLEEIKDLLSDLKQASLKQKGSFLKVLQNRSLGSGKAE